MALVDGAKIDWLQLVTLVGCAAILYFTKISSYGLLFAVAAAYGVLAFAGYIG